MHGHLVGTLVDIRFLGNSHDSRYTRKAGPKARPAFGVYRESWEFPRKRISTKAPARCPKSLPDDGPDG